MDFEKAYNEALERAREYYESEGYTEMADVFPELRESEDERIRKELVEKISNLACGCFISQEQKQKFIVYLEKQKEYVSDNFDDIWTTEDCEELIEAEEKLSPRFKELLKEVCHAWYDKGIELGKKQKEQKPVEIHIDNPNVQKFKPDVKITTSDSSADGKELLYVSNKSYNIGFRDGVNSVKQEWSEKDRDRVAQYLHDKDGGMLWSKATGITRDILNILRPRPHWKPSEEEVGCLERLIAFKNPDPEDINGCKSLLEQLTKLI